jgi:hypothetical protein
VVGNDERSLFGLSATRYFMIQLFEERFPVFGFYLPYARGSASRQFRVRTSRVGSQYQRRWT